ncbi:60S ribosomal protein L14 [Sciurus carolinensis]|uniref:Large ribosomal subunit protein eL14 n=1 Tax=Sciurus carolinensis TaxID=30640 RepID=A0AA41NIZ3_SCICA|nr:60S ribosomal protein L14 [Sciurus carolinensis]
MHTGKTRTVILGEIVECVFEERNPWTQGLRKNDLPAIRPSKSPNSISSHMPAKTQQAVGRSSHVFQRACARTQVPVSRCSRRRLVTSGAGTLLHMRRIERAFFLLAQRRRHGESCCCWLRDWRPCCSTSSSQGILSSGMEPRGSWEARSEDPWAGSARNSASSGHAAGDCAEGPASQARRGPRVFRRFVEVGRVAYVSFGPHAGKLVAIVDVIDQNRALVDGPCTQVRRQAMPFKCMQLTDFILKFPHSARQKYVRQAWQKADINTKWAATRWAKKIDARERKAKMTDFDRYKVMKAKKMRNRIIKNEVKKLQRAAILKASPKKAPVAKAAVAAAAAAAAAAKAKIPAKKMTAAGKKAPAQKAPAQKASSQKAAPPPKAQKGQKTPAQKAPAPKASGKKA